MDLLRYSRRRGGIFRTVSAIILVLFLKGCGPEVSEPDKTSFGGEALGTTYGITYYSEGPSENKINNLAFQQAIDSTFGVINQSMSTYLPDSDISRINRGRYHGAGRCHVPRGI